jgi:hypothetical protein
MYFYETIKSFSICCHDKHIISEIHWLDDSSCESDRLDMYNTLKSNFENVSIIKHFFNKNDISNKNRHSVIMNKWLNIINKSNSDYVFHLEDDWRFYSLFNISDAITLNKNNPVYTYIGFSKSFPNFPVEYYPKNIFNDFWETVYDESKPLRDNLFVDFVNGIKYDINCWITYLNWPYFSLTPGVHNSRKLLDVGEFNINSDPTLGFELEFAIRYKDAGYKSAMHKNFICKHIGEISAYNLNESIR